MAATSFRLHVASMGFVLKVRATVGTGPGSGEGQTLCLLSAYTQTCLPALQGSLPTLLSFSSQSTNFIVNPNKIKNSRFYVFLLCSQTKQAPLSPSQLTQRRSDARTLTPPHGRFWRPFPALLDMPCYTGTSPTQTWKQPFTRFMCCL